MRIFTAIDFSPGEKKVLAEYVRKLEKHFPGFKWINASSWHITLKFIGEADQSIVDAIINILKEKIVMKAFSLETNTAGFFPPGGKARVLYLGLDYSESLEHCFKTIDTALSVIGIEKELRPFRPHITLARLKSLALKERDKEALIQVSAPQLKIKISEIVLMQSLFERSGVRYTPVQRFSLHSN